MVKLGECVVPIINLMNEQQLESPLIQMDETRVQVLSSDKAPTAEHWIWVRASGPPHRRIILFDYDPSRGGAVSMRLLEGLTGILQTDGYEAYCVVAQAKHLMHAGCYAHARRRFEDARKSQADPHRDGQSNIALDLIGQPYRIEREIKVSSAEERLQVRQSQSTPVVRELRPGSIRWPTPYCRRVRWVKPCSTCWANGVSFGRSSNIRKSRSIPTGLRMQ